MIISPECPPRRLAAVALLYLDQEDAFWSLVAIVEVFMPTDYYTKTLLGSQVSRRTKTKLFTSASKVTFNAFTKRSCRAHVHSKCLISRLLAAGFSFLQRSDEGLSPWYLQVDQRVFRDLMSEKLPRLHAHFEQYKVDFSLITFNWFLVVFVDSVVSDILFKIWDAFLFEGPKV